ncbi:hypothetical protein D1007_32599 [Hordeum vulgare]|nr:hypothetical protein D1007_32599 [Hordeum vulgare]
MSPQGEKKKKKMSLSYVEGGGLYRVRHLLTSYVTRWGIDAIMSAHYRCLAECWYSHDRDPQYLGRITLLALEELKVLKLMLEALLVGATPRQAPARTARSDCRSSFSHCRHWSSLLKLLSSSSRSRLRLCSPESLHARLLVELQALLPRSPSTPAAGGPTAPCPRPLLAGSRLQASFASPPQHFQFILCKFRQNLHQQQHIPAITTTTMNTTTTTTTSNTGNSNNTSSSSNQHIPVDDLPFAPYFSKDEMLLDEEEAFNQEAIRTSVNLSHEERFGVYFGLKVIKNRDGAIQKEDKIRIASLMNTGIQMVERICRDANKQIAECHEVVVASKRKGRVGRKRKDLDLSRASTIPLNRRRTVRAIARSLGIPRSTLHRRFKLGELKHVSSTVKPYLKPKNRIARLKFCISMLDELWISTPCPLFKPMTDMIQIDEKWFDMTRVKNTYYLLPQEETPERPIPNSNYISKVIFLTVVAKPRYNDDGEVMFDGKIGTWAFVEEKAAVRTSQNRARGTKELKNVKVTRNVMRDYLCNKVIPAIQDKWPGEDI